MDTTRTRVAGVCIIVFLSLTAAAAAVDGYSISGSSAIETPTQTVSYEGQNYTIDAVSRITAGESVTITTSVPSDATYDINLRGPDNQLISSERKTADTTHTFSYFGPNDEAGTYAATIQDDGNTVAVHPIVIAGYDVSVSSPDDVSAGEEAVISATVTERSVEKHSSLDRVEVVVGNDDVETQKSMTQVDEDTYETTVSTENLATETYNVYVVVRGNKTVRKRAEILGVSDTVELTLTGASTPTETSDDDTISGGGSDTDSETTETAGQTATPTPVPTETTAPTTPRPTESVTATDDGPDGVRTPTGVGEAPTDTGADSVIKPVTSTVTSTSSESGPGFTIGVAVLAVLGAITLAYYRE